MNTENIVRVICFLVITIANNSFSNKYEKIINTNKYDSVKVVFVFFDQEKENSVLKEVLLLNENDKILILNSIDPIKVAPCGCLMDGSILFFKKGKLKLTCKFFLRYNNIVFQKWIKTYSLRIKPAAIKLLNNYQKVFLENNKQLESFNPLVNE